MSSHDYFLTYSVVVCISRLLLSNLIELTSKSNPILTKKQTKSTNDSFFIQ